jgi:hypothetical protein
VSAEPLVDPGHASGPVELVVRVNGTAFRVLAEGDQPRAQFWGSQCSGFGSGSERGLGGALRAGDDVLECRGAYRAAVDGRRADAQWRVAGLDRRLGSDGLDRAGQGVCASGDVDRGAGGDRRGGWGFLLPHRTDKNLRVRHRYPVAPWEWHTVTPDAALPGNALARESACLKQTRSSSATSQELIAMGCSERNGERLAHFVSKAPRPYCRVRRGRLSTGLSPTLCTDNVHRPTDNSRPGVSVLIACFPSQVYP